MLKFTGPQGVKSSEGWFFGSNDRFSFKYVSEKYDTFTIYADASFSDAGKYIGESIFFDTLKPNNPKIQISSLERELIQLRIRKALRFMEISFKEYEGPPNPKPNYDPESKVVPFNALALEKTDIFSTQEEYQKCKEYIELQIKRRFFEKIDIEVDKNNIDKADGEWFRFRVIEKYWRLKEPDDSSSGFCEVYYRVEYYNN